MYTLDRDVDLEWVELMVEAKKLGLSLEEIRDFLKGND
ncbi:anti-repressor SinI family protein [Halobacillus sp. BBL2006]|nr:anti-repressor SinI family protein [Halobacillus sp. BBL2006]